MNLTRLANEILQKNYLRQRELAGGLTGAKVFLVEVDELELPIVVKIGPSDLIEQEAQGRIMYAEQDLKVKKSLSWLKKNDLLNVSDGLVSTPETEDILWKAIVYKYFGAKKYHELNDYLSFEEVFELFCSGEHNEINERALRTQLEDLVNGLEGEMNGIELGVTARLEHLLPNVQWDRGVEPLLQTTAAFISEGGEELANLRSWWEEGVGILPEWPVRRLHHGDLRFANVLVHTKRNSTELIDFGNVQKGHVLQDLAKFECDLLFRILPQQQNDKNEVDWSSEEARMITLRHAFTSDFRCTLQILDQEASSPSLHLRALRILREVYDQKWSISVHQSRHDMYRWFLLAEILKRLLWHEQAFTKTDIRRALVHSILLLKHTIDGEKNARLPCITSVNNLVRLLGCTGAYIATKKNHRSVNECRNSEKEKTILESAHQSGPLILLAETGHSYLSSRRPFYHKVKSMLTNGGKFHIVLCHPYFVEAYAISAAYKDPTLINSLGIHSDFWAKYTDSYNGFQELQRTAIDHGGEIDLKYSPFGMSASILLAEHTGFYEPYFHANRRRRAEQLFDTFELEVSDSDALQLLRDHCDYFWNKSIPYAELNDKKVAYTNLLEQWKKLIQ